MSDHQRTLKQNAALHKYFSLVADALNDSGLDIVTTLKPAISISWSAASVKELLFRPIMKIQLQKKSTTQLNTAEVTLVYDVLNRFLSEEHGLSEPFPSLAEIANRQLYEENTTKTTPRTS